MFGESLPKRRFFFLVMILALARIQFAQAYIVLAEDAAGLWGQADGTGCGNDIVKAAFEASGVSVQLEITPYNRAKVLVLEGKVLACFGMSWSEELAGKVVFASEPIYTTTSTVFVRKADTARFGKAADAPAGTSVGTVLGYEYPEGFVRLVKSGILVPDAAPSEEQSLKKLALGRIDLAIANVDALKSAEFLLSQAGVADKIQTAFTLGSSGTNLGFSSGNPETPAAIRAFDAGMARIRANGSLARILAFWKSKR